MKEHERTWKNMKENERTCQKMIENQRKMKENERKWKKMKEQWKKMKEQWKKKKNEVNEKKRKMRKNEKMEKWKKWKTVFQKKKRKNEKRKKMKTWKKNEKMEKNDAKTKKNEKMDSDAKSSTISKVYRCCCNFFRQNPLRFQWFCFGMCLFPEENQQHVLRGQLFFSRKVTIFIGRETKHTFYRRKSTKIKFAKVSPCNNNICKKKDLNTQQQQHKPPHGK